MYRMLKKEARAPLPQVHRAISKFERSSKCVLSRYELDRRVIAILHEHNWRKRDYLAELGRRARAAASVRAAMSQRPVRHAAGKK